QHDRAQQTVVRQALEPEWEAKLSPHTYGFRPGRSCWDAIEAIFHRITFRPQYVLKVDIAKCFDRINHDALLAKTQASPAIRRQRKAWLQAGVVEDGLFAPTAAGTPQGGTISPPTKLPTFFFGSVITRIRVDPKHNVHLVARDFHPLHQRPDEVPLARPVGGLQAIMEFGSKVLQMANDQLQFPSKGRFTSQRLALPLHAGQPLAQSSNPRLKLLLVNKTLRVTINQAGDALAQLAALAFDCGQGRPFGTRLGPQTASIFLGEPLWVGQQGTHFLPHRQVQQVRP